MTDISIAMLDQVLDSKRRDMGLPVSSDGPPPIADVLGRFTEKWIAAVGDNEENLPYLDAQRAESSERERNHARWTAWDRFTAPIGRRYANVTLDTFVATCPAQEAAVEKLKGYLDNAKENIDAGRGIILFGPAGVGKDHLLIGVARGLIGKDYTAVWKMGVDLFSEMRDRIGDDRATESQFVKTYLKPDVLLLSDPIPPGSVLTDFQRSLLTRIIDGRYRDLKLTFASLNVANSAEADERLGAPLVDRLKDGAIAIYCNWASHRKLLGEEE